MSVRQCTKDDFRIQRPQTIQHSQRLHAGQRIGMRHRHLHQRRHGRPVVVPEQELMRLVPLPAVSRV